MKFRKGDRVRASEAWLARSKYARIPRRTKGGKQYDPARIGTVQINQKADCVTVHWDGNSDKSTDRMHHTFLVHA